MENQTVDTNALGPLTFLRIHSGPRCHLHRAETPEAGAPFFLNVQLRGSGRASQDGRTAHQRPTDLVLLDSARPFEIRFEEDSEQLRVVFPRSLVAARIAAPHAVTAIRVPGDGGLGAAVANRLRFLSDPADVDPAAGLFLAEQLAELVGLALRRASDRGLPESRAAILQSALDEIEAGLPDTSLSAAVVAGRINVSKRYLQRILADDGETFGRRLLARRLERCHRDLSEPSLSKEAVGETAERWGFANRSHFARAFRERYGLTPSEVRQRASAA